jgi:hypothetical protein
VEEGESASPPVDESFGEHIGLAGPGGAHNWLPGSYVIRGSRLDWACNRLGIPSQRTFKDLLALHIGDEEYGKPD